MKKVTVLGDGGWGTTIALLLAGKGYQTTLFSYDPLYAQEMDRERLNRKFLPGIEINPNVTITSNIEQAVRERQFIIIAVPTIYLKKVLKGVKGFNPDTVFVSLTKGIEIESFRRISEIITAELGDIKIAVLSGPSIAYEVVRNVPTSVVAAARDAAVACAVRDIFLTDSFRVYTSSDIPGVEFGGALKNVIAIAAGICDGLAFGANTKAALLSRGLAEMIRFGKVMGARPETFFGLSGLGDMVTTCFSPKSRNRSFGQELAKGRTLKEIMETRETVAEGVYTVKAVYNFSKKQKIDMPITEKVYQVIYENKSPEQAVSELMTRQPKEEDLRC